MPVVTVNRSKGGQFWFSDHRVLFENEGVNELFRYDSVPGAHSLTFSERYRDVTPSIHHITGKFPINNPNGAKLYRDGSASGVGCATPDAWS